MFQQTNFRIIIIWQAPLSVCDAFHLVSSSTNSLIFIHFTSLSHVLFSSLGFAFYFIARFMILQTDEIGEVKDSVHDINLVLLVVISLCCRVRFSILYYLVILAPFKSNISSMLVVVETVYFNYFNYCNIWSGPKAAKFNASKNVWHSVSVTRYMNNSRASLPDDSNHDENFIDFIHQMTIISVILLFSNKK